MLNAILGIAITLFMNPIENVTVDAVAVQEGFVYGHVEWSDGSAAKVWVTARGGMNTQEVLCDSSGDFKIRTPDVYSCVESLYVNGDKVWTGRACQGDTIQVRLR